MSAELDEVGDALNGFDKLFEHRIRLAICSLLARTDAINFVRLRELLEQTDGSLSAQLRKLEDAGYVAVDKRFDKRRPVSWYSLSDNGRKALGRHLEALGALTAGV